MATVSSTNSTIPSVFANSDTTTTSSASATSGATADPLANTQTFMTLLVAQLKNQDPTQPADGMQFVTQLAQFSNLEQSVAMRQDVDSIKTKYLGDSTATTPVQGS